MCVLVCANTSYQHVFSTQSRIWYLFNELRSYFLYSFFILHGKTTQKQKLVVKIHEKKTIIIVSLCMQLEVNLAETERQVLEKELLVDQVTRLSKPLSEQAENCQQDRLSLAKKVDNKIHLHTERRGRLSSFTHTGRTIQSEEFTLRLTHTQRYLLIHSQSSLSLRFSQTNSHIV